MSVDPSQLNSAQAAASGNAASVTGSMRPDNSVASSTISAENNGGVSGVATGGAEEKVELNSATQTSAELSDIANEVQRIRQSQQPVSEASSRKELGSRQRRSNRPGDASVIVGGTKNDALPISDRELEQSTPVIDMENKLASEPERVSSDLGATIREMQDIRRQTLSYYEPAPSDTRRLNKAVQIEMESRRKVEMNELLSKKGNDFGGALINMNPAIAYGEIIKTQNEAQMSQTEDMEYKQRLPEGSIDAKAGVANMGQKVSGSIERYAAAAHFTEKTQTNVETKSLEDIRENLRRLGKFDKR